MAHCHFLEKRVARSLCYQADASPSAASPMAGKAVRAVLKDEDRHVGYTLAAVNDLLTGRQARDVLDAHRRAEAKANVRFSTTQKSLGADVQVEYGLMPCDSASARMNGLKEEPGWR